jgi:NADPH:quinone reductase-like Zn-dependent oxidoreductase
MKAALYDVNGPPSVLYYGDAPDPVPGAGEVLVAVEAISLEGGDAISRRVRKPAAPGYVVGYQAAGRVVGLGPGAQRFKVGDRVATFAGAGSHGALRAVPEATAWKVPDGLDIRTASTIPVTFGTADDALFEFGGLKAGETVLITGSTGGVGLAAVQLARDAGAVVIGVGSDEARLEKVRALGARHTIDYRSDDVPAKARELTGGKGVDLVVDMVGAGLDGLLSAARYRGRLVFVGAASGEAPKVDAMRLLVNGQAFIGTLFGLEIHTERAREMIERHLAGAAAGRLQMPIDKVFPLSEPAAAHTHLETGHPFGRVLMVP